MPPLLVQAPQEGINTTLPDTLISPREAGRRSQNVIYENGYLTTPEGFSAVDIVTGLDKEHGSLASNSSVLNIFSFRELDGYEHLLAVTSPKVYEHDRVNDDWNDIAQSGLTMISAYPNPVSFVAVPNNYGSSNADRIHLNDDTAQAQAFFHCLISNGGLDNVQRWAGRYETDFADLLMTAGDYGGTTQTTHRCHQVSSFRSRTLLISPRTFDASTNLWSENNQDVRWNAINKPQTWTGTGSGNVALIDTGGTNVWSAPLGGTHIIYQTIGIWDLNYVGGTTVFDPRPMIPDLGLLAPHLLAVKNNIHYFVGSDFNVYAYFGGTVKQRLGDKIHPKLQKDLSSEYASRSWMAFGPNNKRVWIFIVLDGELFATKAYGLDIRTGAWQVKDFKDLYTTTTGITSVNLVGSQSFTVGESYNEALNLISTYPAEPSVGGVDGTSGDATLRYGDVLRGDTTSNVVDWTEFDWTTDGLDFTGIEFSEGGIFFCYTTVASQDETGWLCNTTNADSSSISGLVLRIEEGSDSANIVWGTHYFTLGEISHELDVAGASVRVYVNPRDSTGRALADLSADVPDINSISTDTTATLFCPSSNTYRQSIEEIRKQARMVMGDSSGFIYEFDPTHTQYAGNNITARHVTHVEDFEQPDRFKRWNWISVVARENPDIGLNGAVKMRYRIANFDTSDTGWLPLNNMPVVFDVESDCIARWKMNDNAASTTVLDSIGSHNGTAQQNTNLITTTGKTNTALSFNGSTDYISVPDHDDFSFGDGSTDSPFSISVWVYIDGYTGFKIIGKASVGNNEWEFYLSSNNPYLLLRALDGSAYQGRYYNTILSPGGWYHIVATYDGGGGVTAHDGIKLYVDGERKDDTDINFGTYTTMDNGTSVILIGRCGIHYSDGKIDDVMIFNKELSATEVAGLYNAGNGTEELSSNVQTLTSTWKEYKFYNNITSKQIQYEFDSATGSNFQISEYKIGEPQIQDGR